MRLFHMTIGVYVGDSEPLPDDFRDWIRQAFGDEAADVIGASPTFLHSVVETRYPLAEDVVERRRESGVRVLYS